MKNTATTFVVLLAAISAVIPAHADAPVTPPTAEKPMIDVGAFENVGVVDLLKVVAKSFKADVTINSDVSGTLSIFRVKGRSAKEVLESIARVAKLTVTEKDGAFIVSKAVGEFDLIPLPGNPTPPRPTVRANSFQLKLSIDYQQFYGDSHLESKLTLERRAGEPDAAVLWGSTQSSSLQPSVIALKDNSWVPLSQQLIVDLRGVPNPLQNLYSTPTLVTEGKPLGLSFDLSRRLEKPLEPGKYLYFVTYKSQTFGRLLEGKEIFDGQLVSNMVEFEVLPEPPERFQPLDK